ncbi:hypothetical protein [Brucella sp. IR073]|uniref:hypothetical protein n=1 Tax=unclassified Brucella TaxID=2632610 RepID=UPI003B983776
MNNQENAYSPELAKEGRDLVKAFFQIADPAKRQKAMAYVMSLAEPQKASKAA